MAVTDPAGTTTASVDLLGRTVTSADVWGTVTAPVYESLTGRVLEVTVTPLVGVARVLEYDYDVE